jgi:hypothetical protein
MGLRVGVVEAVIVGGERTSQSKMNKSIEDEQVPCFFRVWERELLLL